MASKLWYIGQGTGKYSSSGAKESTIQSNIIKAISRAFPGAIINKNHAGGQYVRSGVPDLYIGLQGVSVWLEVKRPGGDTTKTQYLFMQKLINQCIPVGVVDNSQDAVDTIKDALRRDGKKVEKVLKKG